MSDRPRPRDASSPAPRRHAHPSQAQRQARPQTAGVLPPVPHDAPVRARGCGLGTVRCVRWSWWPPAPAAGRVSCAGPRWLRCAGVWLASRRRERGQGPSVVGWGRRLGWAACRPSRGGVLLGPASWVGPQAVPWPRSARQDPFPRCPSLCQASSSKAHGGGGGRSLGGQGTGLGLQHPNTALEATGHSVGFVPAQASVGVARASAWALGCCAQRCFLAWPGEKADHVRRSSTTRRIAHPSQVRRQARPQQAGVLPPVLTGSPGRAGGCGAGPGMRGGRGGGPGPCSRVAGGVPWPVLAPTRTCGAGVTSPSAGGRSPRGWVTVPPAPWGAACRLRRGGALQGPAAGGAASRAVSPPHQARHGGAARSRAVVQGTRVPRALHPCPWCRVSRHLPSPRACGGIRRPGWGPRGWRRSVTGRRGPPRREPATQQKRAGDGCQRPLVPRSRCPPRLTPSVRRPERWGTPTRQETSPTTAVRP